MGGQATFLNLVEELGRAALLPILSVEIMAEAFRKKKKIWGITISSKEIKMSQYADDTTLISYGSTESFKAKQNFYESDGKQLVSSTYVLKKVLNGQNKKSKPLVFAFHLTPT